MMYYLIRLIEPHDHEVRFCSLSTKICLPSKEIIDQYPSCFLDIKTGDLADLRIFTDKKLQSQSD